jgi:hypothetical protein
MKVPRRQPYTHLAECTHAVHMACPSTVRTQPKSLLKKFCSFLNRSFGTLKFSKDLQKKHNCQRIDPAVNKSTFGQLQNF